MAASLFTSVGNRLIFPAPRSSYDQNSFQGNLFYVPWDSGIGAPATHNTTVSSSNSTGGNKLGNLQPKEIPKEAGPGVPVLWFPSATAASTVILYMHGNAEDLGMTHTFSRHMTDQFRVNVLSLEYPGYGLLNGCQATEENLYLVCVTALRFLVDDMNVKYPQIIAMGRSIGSGPACYLASKYPLGGLLLISPFSSIRTAIHSVAGKMLSNFFPEIFSNVDQIANVQCPTLLIHGKRDQLIPSEHSVNLLRACRATRKKLVCPSEMEHNSNLFSHADFLAIPVISFFGLPGYCTSRAPRMPVECGAQDMLRRHLERMERGEKAKKSNLREQELAFGWLCKSCVVSLGDNAEVNYANSRGNDLSSSGLGTHDSDGQFDAVDMPLMGEPLSGCNTPAAAPYGGVYEKELYGRNNGTPS